MNKYRDVLVRAAKTAAQAFVAAFAILSPGVWAAPNLNEGKALLVSAVTGAIAAAVSAAWNVILQAFPAKPAA